MEVEVEGGAPQNCGGPGSSKGSQPEDTTATSTSSTPSENITLGIDFGSSNCRVTINRGDGVLDNLKTSEGDVRIPSYVCFAGREMKFGIEAEDLMDLYPNSTVHNLTRLIGRRFEEIDLDREDTTGFNLVEQNGRLMIQVEVNGETRTHLPELIVSLLLSYLRDCAEATLEGKKVQGVVITVPASFGNAQRKAIMTAAEIAGLNVLRLMSGSTAAAIAFAGQMGLMRWAGNNAERNENANAAEDS